MAARLERLTSIKRILNLIAIMKEVIRLNYGSRSDELYHANNYNKLEK